MEPATDKEIILMLTEDNERLITENKDLKRKLYDIEGEMFKYKTAFKLLVKEISEKK